MTTFTLEGRIEPGVVVTPQRLIFGEVIRGTPASKEFTAEVVGTSQSRVIGAKSFSRFINVEEESSDSRKKQFIVSLAPDLPLEEFRTRVTLTVQGADGKQREMDVPVFASVKGNLKMTPPALSLGILEGDKPIERSVKLEYVGPGTVHIKSVESSDKAVTVSSKGDKNGRLFVLQVQADPSRVNKDIRAAITVTAIDSEGKEATASLNVYGVLPPR